MILIKFLVHLQGKRILRDSFLRVTDQFYSFRLESQTLRELYAYCWYVLAAWLIETTSK